MHENGDESASHGELSDEDVSEQAVQERHSRCEEAERKKFMSYIKLPLVSRGRANRRTDSRAESSGANTPGIFNAFLSSVSKGDNGNFSVQPKVGAVPCVTVSLNCDVPKNHK